MYRDEQSEAHIAFGETGTGLVQFPESIVWFILLPNTNSLKCSV